MGYLWVTYVRIYLRKFLLGKKEEKGRQRRWRRQVVIVMFQREGGA